MTLLVNWGILSRIPLSFLNSILIKFYRDTEIALKLNAKYYLYLKTAELRSYKPKGILLSKDTKKDLSFRPIKKFSF